MKDTDCLKVKKSGSKAHLMKTCGCTLFFLLMLISFMLAGKLIYDAFLPYGIKIGVAGYLIASMIILVILNNNRIFNPQNRSYSIDVIKCMGIILIIDIAFIALLDYFFDIKLSLYYLVVLYTLQIISGILLKELMDFLFIGSIKEELTLIVGRENDKLELLGALKKVCKGNLAFVSSEDQNLNIYVDQANEIFYSGKITQQFRDNIVSYCMQKDKRVYFIPDILDIAVRNSTINNVGDIPVFEINSFQLTKIQRIIKRLGDIILSVFGILITSPIVIITSIAIKFDDGGPVLYQQERVGLNGKIFKVLKFRSMIVDAEKYSGAVFATENDVRITKIGRFIRATRVDEIPQFLNVLIGDMSIVGPRPEREKFVQEFSKKYPEYPYRLHVKPGITGFAQVMGNYTTSVENKIKFDLIYIINYSFWLDIKLFFRTIKVVLRREQAEGFSKTREGLVIDATELTKESFVRIYQRKRTRKSKSSLFRISVLLCGIVIIISSIIMSYRNVAVTISEAIKQNNIEYITIAEINLDKNFISNDFSKSMKNLHNLISKFDSDELLRIEKISKNGLTDEEKEEVRQLIYKQFIEITP